MVSILVMLGACGRNVVLDEPTVPPSLTSAAHTQTPDLSIPTLSPWPYPDLGIDETNIALEATRLAPTPTPRPISVQTTTDLVNLLAATSPGQHLLMFNGPGDGPALLIANIETRQLAWVTEALAQTVCPSEAPSWPQIGGWSHDQRYLAVQWNSAGLNVLYVYDRQQHTFTLVPPVPGYSIVWDDSFSWLPVGHQLLVRQAYRPGPTPTINPYPAPESLTQVPSTATPTPTPARVSDYTESWLVFDPESAARRQLRDLSSDSRPMWTQDGQAMLLSGNVLNDAGGASVIEFVPLDGSPPRRIVERESWEKIAFAGWSQDAQQFYVTTRSISPHDRGQLWKVTLADGTMTALDLPGSFDLAPDHLHAIVTTRPEAPNALSTWALYQVEPLQRTMNGNGYATWMDDGRLLVSECIVDQQQQSSGRIYITSITGQEQSVVDQLSTCQITYASSDTQPLALFDPVRRHIQVVDLNKTVIADFDGFINSYLLAYDVWVLQSAP